MKQEKTCGAVVFHDGKILMEQKQETGYWLYPRGHVERDETEGETAVREVFEETGVRMRIVPGFRESYRYLFRKKDGTTVEKETIVFVAEALRFETAPLLTEVSKTAWLTQEDAVGSASHQEIKNILLKAFSFAKERGLA